MQTFLPYRDLAQSARSLDRQRLGKQRVENMQIMKALAAPEQSPASIVKHWVTGMWRGHEAFLMEYQCAVVDEWVGRGYNDTCLDKTRAWFRHFLAGAGEDWASTAPAWWGDDRVFRAHRERLLAKDPAHYAGQFMVGTPIDDYPDWMKELGA